MTSLSEKVELKERCVLTTDNNIYKPVSVNEIFSEDKTLIETVVEYKIKGSEFKWKEYKNTINNKLNYSTSFSFKSESFNGKLYNVRVYYNGNLAYNTYTDGNSLFLHVSNKADRIIRIIISYGHTYNHFD